MSTSILVSAVLSIKNRSRLFSRALDGYLWQTLPAKNWEIVLVDDMSDEDLAATYRRAEGRINLRHVRMDHTRHHVWKERNAGQKTGEPEDWFHTPALSTNLGASLALGDVVCLCHPEVLHAPWNFERALALLEKTPGFHFGLTYLGTAETNRLLDADPDWRRDGWAAFLARAGAGWLAKYGYEKYWYTSFLPRKAIEAVRGVSFKYLNGVGGEDDDFKNRIRQAGYPDIYSPGIEGLHQDHTDDKDSWTYKSRLDPARFGAALNRNRALLYARLGQPRAEFGPIPCGPGFPTQDNLDCDWTAGECLVSVRQSRVAT